MARFTFTIEDRPDGRGPVVSGSTSLPQDIPEDHIEADDAHGGIPSCIYNPNVCVYMTLGGSRALNSAMPFTRGFAPT